MDRRWGGAAVRPWVGRAERTDWIIVAGIGARGLYGLAMLPLIPVLLASHPLLLTLLSGSTVAEVTVGAQVRLGEVSWPVAVLAGLPAWLLFDWLYWWAGRRWGDRALTVLLARGGRPQAARRAARLERVVHRLGPAGVLLAWFLPVPNVLIYAAAGLAGMRLVTFLLLDLVGTALAVTFAVSLGYALGRRAVDLVQRLDDYALAITLALVVVLVVAQVVRHRRFRSGRAPAVSSCGQRARTADMDEAPHNLHELWPLAVERASMGVAVLDGAGMVVSANRTLRTLVGQGEMLGRPFSQFTRAEDLEALTGLARRSGADDDVPPSAVVRLDRADGSIRWVAVRASRVHDDEGRLAHVVVEVEDVTARRRDEERLGEATDHLDHERRLAQAILDTVDVGLVLIDRDGRYERMNRRHTDFMNLAYPDGHLGRAGQLGAVFARDGATRLTAEQMPTTRAAHGEEFNDQRIWVGEDPMTRRALRVSSRPVLDEAGCFTGAALAYTDVTDAAYAERSRNDFVATVSHELRTPLTSILSHLELLEGHYGARYGEGEEEIGASLRAVQRNAQRLDLLVADLVESAQHQRGAFVLDRRRCDVAALVLETVAATQPLAARAGIELRVEAAAGIPAVVDPHRLRQVLDNLLSNALKYTGHGGRVLVTARLEERGGAFEIVIADTGPGIAQADVERVFWPFYRSEGARHSQVPGVGLGLGVVRAIVVAHGGEVSVGGAPGHGSTFRVLVPLGA